MFDVLMRDLMCLICYSTCTILTARGSRVCIHALRCVTTCLARARTIAIDRSQSVKIIRVQGIRYAVMDEEGARSKPCKRVCAS